MSDKIEVVPPNEKILDIILLHLQKYEHLDADDRKLYRKVIEAFTVAPLLFVTPRSEER